MIKVHELTKIFKVRDEDFVAVDHVSFEVQPGTVFGLLGPNGAGKTTTMRMILGLLPADVGYAEISGVRSDVDPNGVKRQVGFVSASAGVYQWLTAREMLEFFGDIYGLDPDETDAQIDALAELLDFKRNLSSRCTTLSTGEKQRVNLARALMHDPPVMILDEPTLGLDVVGSQVIFDYIDLLKERGKAIVLCTHRLEQAQRICGQFGLLHQGKMVNKGELGQLQSETGKEDLVSMFIDLIRQSENDGESEIESEHGTNGVAC